MLARIIARPVLRTVPEDIIERIEQRCAETVSEMRCPWHQQNARVVVDSENLNHLELEIICCCDRFANRVRAALQKPLNQG